jgi:hypothetical protein
VKWHRVKMRDRGMIKTKKLGLLSAAALTLGLIVATAPAFAHHSFVAEFDTEKPITLTGTVTKLEWTNPHVHFYVSVGDKDGTTTTWDFEVGSPNGLERHGWKRSSLKPGDIITVNGYSAKDGSNLASARSVILADGTKIFAGLPDDSQTQ